MSYREGKLHGTMIIYGKDGKPVSQVEYADGLRVKALPPAVRQQEGKR
jgi:antitoxin component YwqK of YwqJK toxin-antitoxin module